MLLGKEKLVVNNTALASLERVYNMLQSSLDDAG
jgi:hypothetical protein